MWISVECGGSPPFCPRSLLRGFTDAHGAATPLPIAGVSQTHEASLARGEPEQAPALHSLLPGFHRWGRNDGRAAGLAARAAHFHFGKQQGRRDDGRWQPALG